MASTEIPTTSVSVSFPSPTSSHDSSNELMQRGASYFFGFLITFVVLLLVFLCCGVGSRRRYVARRALMVGTDWDEHKAPLVEPSLWEPRLEKGGLDWSRISPLSASVIRKPRSLEPPTLLSAASLMSPMNLIRPFLNNSPQTLGVYPPARDEPPPEALQVAVMIAMPSSSQSHLEQNDYNETSQFEIGVTRIRWETEVKS